MYRTDVKYGRPHTYYYDPQGSPVKVVTYGKLDAVFSFRSGGTKGANPVVDIRIPDFTNMKPAQRLKELGQFYRDFSESTAALSTAASEANQGRVSTTDTGHEFLSVKIDATGPTNRYSNNSGLVFTTPSYVQPDLVYGILPKNPIVDKMLSYHPSGDIKPGLYFNSARRVHAVPKQSDLNYLFSKVRSEKPALDIGETILELVKGNPFELLNGTLSALHSLFRLAKGGRMSGRQFAAALSTGDYSLSAKTAGKSAKRLSHDVGSTYLFGLFGASPLIQDIAKTVKYLTEIHATVYGQRKRFESGTQLVTESATIGPNGIGNTLGTFAAGYSALNFEGGYNLPPSFCGEKNITRSWDTRLTCRVAGLARPNSTQSDFLSKAENLMYNLGLQEPELFWDLTSFSWLLDWWLHLGTSIANASRLSGNGVNVDYAYATTWVTSLVTQRQIRATNSSRTATWEYPAGLAKTFTVTKLRQRANPFGFGGDLSSLSSGQMSVLTALGLAKTR